MSTAFETGGSDGGGTAAESGDIPSTREVALLDLLDQTTEMICTSNPDGQITYANDSWQRTLGYTLGEAKHLRPAEMVASEQRATYVELARRLHKGEAIEDYEAVLIAKDGRRVVCRGRASPRIIDGELVEVRAIYRDVTAERRIDGMRARLVATLEATSDFVSIATRSGEIAFLNRAGRRLVGLSERDDLSTVRADALHPPDELRRLFAEAVPAALREGRWEGESRLLSRSGEEIPVSMVIVAHPSVRPDEPPYFLSTVMRDLRERVRVEAALRMSEGRFRGVLENLRLIAMVLDANGNVLFANDHLLALSGWSREEVIGTNWFDRFVPPEYERAAAYAAMIAQENIPTHSESVLVLKNGVRRRIAWDNVTLRDAENHLIGTASVGRDVDEERRVQAMKDQVIATVSHELRSPLGAIRSALQLLSRQIENPAPRVNQLLDIAIRNTDGLLRLTKELLDLERVESGTLQMDLAAVSTADLVTNAIGIMEHAAEGAGVTLSGPRAADAAILFVMADADRIMQVLMNLLSNAIKFSPRGSTIGVTALAEGDVVRVSVADEGRGIPAEKLESIFERFEQVHASDAREKGGAGIGLAICRALVEQHGGRIWAENRPGGGSVLHFTLPAARAPSPPPSDA